MDEYLDVKIDIFEHTGQRARLRRSLTVSGLIDEILKEFDDVPAESIEKYAIYLKDVARPLSVNSSIIELDLQPQDELVFDYKHQTIRQMLFPEQFAYLLEETSGTKFDIQWQPSVIGRPTAEAEHNLMLAVNAQLIPNGMTISRRHAQITFSDDCYYIESLSENNPIFLNGKEIPFNTKWEINSNDKLSFGRHKVTLSFFTQRQDKSAASEMKSRPIPPVIAAEVQSQPVSHPVSQPVKSPQPSSNQTPAFGGDESGAILDKMDTLASSLIIEKATTPEQIGQRIDINSFPLILGRILPLLSEEKGVSRRHAEVSYDPHSKVYAITDLNSTNGVTLEGKRITAGKPYIINVGSRFGLGQDVVLKLEK